MACINNQKEVAIMWFAIFYLLLLSLIINFLDSCCVDAPFRESKIERSILINSAVVIPFHAVRREA